MGRVERRAWGLLLPVAIAACASTSTASTRVSSGSTAAPVVTTTSTSTTSTTQAPTTTTTPLPAPATDRTVVDPLGSAFAQVGDLYLTHPSSRVERVGFHESSVLGAQELDVVSSAVRPTTLNTRSRGTGDRTAADVVVQPGTVVLAPVSGTVVKAGAYRLYCSYDDETVVIEPDSHPGWWVTVLHVEGVQVVSGQRVEAGTTSIAAQARQLPFPSQVDRLASTPPAWPHVHLEVDDPAVVDEPSKGDSC